MDAPALSQEQRALVREACLRPNRVSSERLAVDRFALTPKSDASLRALSDRRRRLEDTRLRAEERLADAEARLAQLGWRGRRRDGPELQAEIGLLRAALRIASQQLAEIPPVTKPATLQRSDRTLARPSARERALMNRRTPQRREHELGL